MTKPARFVGIDVAQASLAVAVHPAGPCWTVANDPTRLVTLQCRFQRQSPCPDRARSHPVGLERLAASTIGTVGLPASLARRRQLLRMRTAEQNRLAALVGVAPLNRDRDSWRGS